MKYVIVSTLIFLTIVSFFLGPQIQSDFIVAHKGSVVLLAAGGGCGSGFIMRGKSGRKYIMTAAHVCTHLPYANLATIDEEQDLCAIPYDTDKPALKLASSVRDFEQNWVMGFPRCETLTLTEGVFVGTTPFRAYDVNISTAQVYPGNSGGPVFNKFGHVVGMVDIVELWDNTPIHRSGFLQLQNLQNFVDKL